MSISKREQYWRMQLHPNKPKQASCYAAQSLSAGFIGLDFAQDVGDLLRANQQTLPAEHRDYWSFAHEMRIGDLVLIISHHFPFALARVDGDYNYIREPVPEIGVWFRHFRRVRDVRYYSDLVTNAASWEQITMTDTISPLRDEKSASWQLIHSWKFIWAAEISISGDATYSYRIDSINNIGAEDWKPLTILTLSTNLASWIDQDSTNRAKRFYRAVVIP